VCESGRRATRSPLSLEQAGPSGWGATLAEPSLAGFQRKGVRRPVSSSSSGLLILTPNAQCPMPNAYASLAAAQQCKAAAELQQSFALPDLHNRAVLVRAAENGQCSSLRCTSESNWLSRRAALLKLALPPCRFADQFHWTSFISFINSPPRQCAAATATQLARLPKMVATTSSSREEEKHQEEKLKPLISRPQLVSVALAGQCFNLAQQQTSGGQYKTNNKLNELIPCIWFIQPAHSARFGILNLDANSSSFFSPNGAAPLLLLLLILVPARFLR